MLTNEPYCKVLPE